MLSSQQQKWIDHLSNDDKIIIKPYDPTSQEKFKKLKTRLLSKLGPKINIQQRGATSLGISGQDEIDIYIPVPPNKFDSMLVTIEKILGKPKSCYPLERARFVTEEDGKHIDVFLINDRCDGWVDGLKFEQYLKTHSDSLDTYRRLKELGNGLSTREYYKNKIEFINEILEKV